MENMQQDTQLNIENLPLANGQTLAQFLHAQVEATLDPKQVQQQLTTNTALVKRIKQLLRPANPQDLVQAYAQFAADLHSQALLLWRRR